MAYPCETFREYVLCEPPDKLFVGQCNRMRFSPTPVIFCRKGDIAIFDIFLRRWLLMAILWVYRPMYSVTCAGPKNGRLQYTVQPFSKSFLYNPSSNPICFRKPSTKWARNTFDIAFTGNRYLTGMFPFHLWGHTTARHNTMQMGVQ